MNRILCSSNFSTIVIVPRLLSLGTLIINCLLQATAAVAAIQPEVMEVPEVPGMFRQTFENQNPSTQLNLKLQSSGRCKLGDLDIMRQELVTSNTEHLLLSFETLFPSTFKPVTKKLTIDQIIDGQDLTLYFPPVSEATHFGIFICKDSLGFNRCSGKASSTYEALQTMYGAPGKSTVPVDPAQFPTDKIYFFAYIFLDSKSMSVINSQSTADDYNKLKTYLAKRTPPNSEHGVTQRVVEQIHRLNKNLASISPALNNKFISINLPRLDLSQCEKTKTETTIGSTLAIPE